MSTAATQVAATACVRRTRIVAPIAALMATTSAAWSVSVARQQFDEAGADEGDGQRELGPPAGRGQLQGPQVRPPAATGRRARRIRRPGAGVPALKLPPSAVTRSRAAIRAAPAALPPGSSRNLQLQPVGQVAQRHGHRLVGGAADGHQPVLHDAVGRQLDAGRQRPALALDLEVDHAPAGARVGQQPIELLEGGTGCARPTVGAAQEPE